ncbi:putative integral membrane protein [Corynebacterium xerosis]|nr:putative integral membrane protein [Corynebacterium xerosis]
MTSSRSPLRLLRGSVAATLATLVALGGHLVGGGAMPSWLGIALPWWLSVTACTVLAGTRFSLPRMLTAVLASQALFHGLFMAGTPGDPSVHLVDPPGSHLGHGAQHPGTSAAAESLPHSAHLSPDGSQGVGLAAEHALHGSGGDLRMLLWHVIAAVVTALVLHRGESMVMGSFGLAARLLDVLARRRVPSSAPALVLPAPARVLPVAVPVRPRRRAVLSPQLRRGPPLVLAA